MSDIKKLSTTLYEAIRLSSSRKERVEAIVNGLETAYLMGKSDAMGEISSLLEDSHA